MVDRFPSPSRLSRLTDPDCVEITDDIGLASATVVGVDDLQIHDVQVESTDVYQPISTRQPVRQHGVTDDVALPLLLVALDHSFWTHVDGIGILPRVTSSTPLTQQIPTLVERNLDRSAVGEVLFGWSGSGVRSLQRVLVVDQFADPVNDLDLVHASVLSTRLSRCSTS